MNKIQLEIAGLSSSHAQTGSFALVLGETVGRRRLPIIIGMFEAQAIAIELENIVSNRPMTHDLFKSFSEKLNFNIESILISDLKEGVFFAKINCLDEGSSRRVEIDARPSDAIAIALRFEAPIFATEKVMSEAGIIINDEEESETGVQPAKTSEEEEGKSGAVKKISSLEDLSLDELNTKMEEAINKEDYEQAAKIRDEISKRED